ncbi:MAG: RHS repeat-associated core domain-containing protein [Hyphomicrobiales bacterium]
MPGRSCGDANRSRWRTLDWTYDGVGNRLSETLAGTPDTYVYPPTSNRLDNTTRSGGTIRSFAYDAIGNIITDTRGGDVITYTYDDRNRPVTVARYGGSWASYAYNGLEQLVTRATTVPVGPIGGSHYVYDLDGHLIAEADALTGATIREYLWLDERPIAIVDNVSTTPVLYFVHADHLARPVLVTDATKAPVWSAVWKPFGEAQSITGPLSLDARFPGQWFQIETGLAYNWHRHYDAATGRYIQPDPLGLIDGPSVYAYAANSPLTRIDPRGLMNFLAGMGAGARAATNSEGGNVCTADISLLFQDATSLLHLVGRKSAPIRCVNCGTPTGTTFAPYCPQCYDKSLDPNGGVPPLAGPWVVAPADED